MNYSRPDHPGNVRGRKTGQADDVRYDWVNLSRSGRESGGWIYLDRGTLRSALAGAGIDPDTPTEAIEVRRFAMRGDPGTGRIALKVRVRKEPGAKG